MGSRPDSTDVFCGNHPARETTIFETRNFYVIPANTPMAPGHLLVIPKRHYPTFGAVPGGLEKEYTEIVEMLKRFVMDVYGKAAVVWENGGPRSGQSVHHAHL